MIWILISSYSSDKSSEYAWIPHPFLQTIQESTKTENFATTSSSPSCEVPRIQFPSQTDPPITVPPYTTSNPTSVTKAPSNFITSYFQQFSKDGVKDIINIKDRAANTTLSYYDTVTDLQHIPRKCPEGYVYDMKTKTCNAQCPTFEKMTYPHGKDSSGVCTPKCTKSYQYYDIFTGDCKECPIGYKSDGNNNCIAMEPCSHGAQYIDHVSGCQSCPFGQSFDASFQCTSNCLSYEDYNYDGTCSLKCPLDYQFSDPNYGCQNCPTGYLKDGSNNCVLAPPCPVGEFRDSAGRCLSECYVYDKYDAGTKTCAPICSGSNPIYNPLSKECIPCPAGQVYSGANNTCVPAPTQPAPTCGPGYSKQVDGTCKSYCDYWRQNDTGNPTSCVLKCPKTQYFDNVINFGCVDCPDGYTVNAYNKCQAPPKATCGPGYIMNPTTNECESYCDDWRINDTKNPRKCNLICPSPNERYDTNQNDCIKCPPNYEVNSNNVCVEKSTITCPPGTTQQIDGSCKTNYCPEWRTPDPANPFNCKLICSASQYFDTTYAHGCVDCSAGWGVDRYNKCTVELAKVDSVNDVGGSGGGGGGGSGGGNGSGNTEVMVTSVNENMVSFKITSPGGGTINYNTNSNPFDASVTGIVVPFSVSLSSSIPNVFTIKFKNNTTKIITITSKSGSDYTPTNNTYLYKIVYNLIGGGGGGGSGGATGDSNWSGCCGGGGGAGKVISEKTFKITEASSGGKITTTVGTAGVGGATTSNGNGNNGTDGGSSILKVNDVIVDTADGGKGGGGGGGGGGNNCSGGSGGAGYPNGYNGNDWANSVNGSAKGGNNGTINGTGGSGGIGGKNYNSGNGTNGSIGVATYTAYYFIVT